MDVSVVIPIGPGHEKSAIRAADSVRGAWAFSTGPFARLQVIMEPDPDSTGAAKTRNRALDRVEPGGWIIFLDADDTLEEKAFFSADIALMAHPKASGIWGRWTAVGHPKRKAMDFGEPEFDWDRMVSPKGLPLGMSGMFRAAEAKRLGFDERWSRCEGSEFCFSFAATWQVAMIPAPFIIVDHGEASAKGPKRQGFQVGRLLVNLRKHWTERGRVPLSQKEMDERRERAD